MARRFVVAGLFVPLIAALIGVGAGAASASKPEVQKTNHGHEFKAKDAKTLLGFGRNPNLTNHGGPIMSASAQVTPIYWGPSSSFSGDKIGGLASFYSGWGGSGYGTTTTEYTGPGGTRVSGALSYNGAVTDTLNSPPTSPPSTATILAEVSRMIPSPVAAGYYPVYVSLKRGNAGYCAWHDTGTVHGVQVEVAFFFNLDGDNGCDPGDTSGNHSQGLAALANVSGHELSEAKTDPQLNAWYDRQGAENSDKCAWTFGPHLLQIGSSLWKIQGNWSNAAYNAGGGYPQRRGCIDGG